MSTCGIGVHSAWRDPCTSLPSLRRPTIPPPEPGFSHGEISGSGPNAHPPQPIVTRPTVEEIWASGIAFPGGAGTDSSTNKLTFSLVARPAWSPNGTALTCLVLRFARIFPSLGSLICVFCSLGICRWRFVATTVLGGAGLVSKLPI